jgi:hypothetical protein
MKKTKKPKVHFVGDGCHRHTIKLVPVKPKDRKVS